MNAYYVLVLWLRLMSAVRNVLVNLRMKHGA
jgi:hypothetical protein